MPAASDKLALIVDDEQALQRLLVRILERAGIATLVAGDADEARRLVAEHGDRIDVVLLDAILPGVGGEVLLPELTEKRPALRVIMMSGDELPSALAETLAEHGGRFLRKPFVPRALMRALAEIGLPTRASPPRPGAGGAD